MKYKKFSILFLLFIATFLLILPLFHYGFPPTHDGEYHIIRAYQFDKTLRDGNWYPRWLPDLNYGYGIPLANYYYPLPYYVMSLFHAFGIGFIDSFKLEMILSIFFATFFFYKWARLFWGDVGGIVGSVFYIFSPYFILDIYIRGSIGEVLSLGFFPACLWAITNVFRKENRIFIFLSTLFLSAIIFSHNVAALMFFPFMLSYMAFLLLQAKERKKYLLKCLAIIALGLGLSAIFWIPALFETNYVVGLQIFDVTRHFPDLYQLLIPSWGSGFSDTDIQNQMSFQIGIANLFAVVVSCFAVVFLKRKSETKPLTIFFIVWFFVIFFLMTGISKFIWRTVPFMNYFQFPWRFLSLEILIASFLAASTVSFWRSRLFLIVMVLVPILLTIQYTIPAYYWERDDTYYFKRANFMDGTNTPGNTFNTRWMKAVSKRAENKIEITQGDADIKNLIIKSQQYSFISDVKSKKATLNINTMYFPGWYAYVDSRKKIPEIQENGAMSLSIDHGPHSIVVRLGDTSVRSLGTFISIVSMLIAVFFLVNGTMRKYGKRVL